MSFEGLPRLRTSKTHVDDSAQIGKETTWRPNREFFCLFERLVRICRMCLGVENHCVESWGWGEDLRRRSKRKNGGAFL